MHRNDPAEHVTLLDNQVGIQRKHEDLLGYQQSQNTERNIEPKEENNH